MRPSEQGPLKRVEQRDHEADALEVGPAGDALVACRVGGSDHRGGDDADGRRGIHPPTIDLINNH